MIDVNKTVRSILNKIEGVTVTFYHPGTFNKLPVISYYEIGTTGGASWDNEEQAQRSNVVIDIWAGSAAKSSELAVEVDKLIQAEGWRREFSCDLPPEDKICHKNMRFSKEIFF